MGQCRVCQFRAALPFSPALAMEEAMSDEPLTLTQQKLKTPRAAALAGVLFAVLFSSGVRPSGSPSLPIPRMAACGSKTERGPFRWR